MLFFGVVWCGLNNKIVPNTMKTYLKTIRVPRLVIEHEEGTDNPRFDSNIGYFFTKERNRISPDGDTHALYQIMMETQEEANDTTHHIELMRARAHKEFKESAPKGGNSHDEELHIIEIHPVYRYEHGNVVYKRGTAQGFDYANCGFYIVTAQSISGETHTAESIAKAIDAELEVYTKWCNGEVYRFTLYGENGEQEDACGGFYDIEDIRESLPEDFKDEKLEEYLAH